MPAALPDRTRPTLDRDTTSAERAELLRYVEAREDGAGVIEEWNAILAATRRRPMDDDTARRLELSATELESEGLTTSAAGVRRRASEATRPRGGSSAARGGAWLSQALQAWDDTRRALMAFERRIIEAAPDERTRPREVRRALQALRAADRTRPAWVDVDVLGDATAQALWTEAQMRATRSRAQQLRTRLETASEAMRDVQRTQPRGWAQEAAAAAEATITGILRPLSLAVSTATGPAQRSFGAGLGIGLAALAALFFSR